jgi:hypothetical protein
MQIPSLLPELLGSTSGGGESTSVVEIFQASGYGDDFLGNLAWGGDFVETTVTIIEVTPSPIEPPTKAPIFGLVSAAPLRVLISKGNLNDRKSGATLTPYKAKSHFYAGQ